MRSYSIIYSFLFLEMQDLYTKTKSKASHSFYIAAPDTFYPLLFYLILLHFLSLLKSVPAAASAHGTQSPALTHRLFHHAFLSAPEWIPPHDMITITKFITKSVFP